MKTLPTTICIDVNGEDHLRGRGGFDKELLVGGQGNVGVIPPAVLEVQAQASKSGMVMYRIILMHAKAKIRKT